MITVFSLLLWSAMFIMVSYLSWRKIVSHIKVYLFIIYNALFLCGVFLLSAFLKV